jgi:hypothetical protein
MSRVNTLLELLCNELRTWHIEENVTENQGEVGPGMSLSWTGELGPDCKVPLTCTKEFLFACVFLVCCFFETDSLCSPDVASLDLPSAGTIGVCHHTQLFCYSVV